MRAAIMVLFVFILQSCYSFKGISIDPSVSTYFVQDFEDLTGELPPGFIETYSLGLNRKIRQETRLSFLDGESDITFSGQFTRFEIRSEDPNNEEQTSINRLYITLVVDYYNAVTEEEWTKTYDEREDFDADVLFFDVQDQLLDLISKRNYENIFNDAFTNW